MARTRSRASSSVSVGASPVEPEMTSPCDPCSSRWVASFRAATSSTAPLSSKGVAIAVRTPRISFIAPAYRGRLGGDSKQLLQPDRETLGLLADLAHGEQHPGHEGAAI